MFAAQPRPFMLYAIIIERADVTVLRAGEIGWLPRFASSQRCRDVSTLARDPGDSTFDFTENRQLSETFPVREIQKPRGSTLINAIKKRKKQATTLLFKSEMLLTRSRD